jgi:hypothetical protein
MVIPEHLAPDVAILRRSFPHGVQGEDRSALMAAIYDEFSERNVGEVLEDLLGGDRHQLLGEAIQARSRYGRSPQVDVIRRLLQEQGWEFDS